jgi:hypothetical protein
MMERIWKYPNIYGCVQEQANTINKINGNDDYSSILVDFHGYFDRRVRLIDDVAFPFNVIVRTYDFLLMMVMIYGENCDFDPFLCKVDKWVHNGYKDEAEGVVV